MSTQYEFGHASFLRTQPQKRERDTELVSSDESNGIVNTPVLQVCASTPGLFSLLGEPMTSRQ
jgi:hypothetical protein